MGEVGEIITGKTPSVRNPEDWGNNFLFITPSDYCNYGKYAKNSIRKLSVSGLERLKKKVLPPKSILVTCIGSDMGKVVMNNVMCITNQQINAIVPYKEYDNDFVYYSLLNAYDTLRVLGGDGTAVPIVNKSDFENIVLKMPSLVEQKRIAGVLSSLDDKIDLLHRENETLEALAETLFRHYFIENPNPTWKEGKLGDYIKTTSGGTPSRKIMKYYTSGSFGWVKSKELHGTFIFETEENITEEAVCNSSAKVLPANSVLIAMYGATVGEYGILAHPMTCNQAVCALLPNEKYPYSYLFGWTIFHKQDLINLATGAAQQNISQDLIKQQTICTDYELIKTFDKQVGSFLEKIKSNQYQILSLSVQRDMLLPRLMSGEVKIYD